VQPDPRPDPITWICAGLVASPAIVMLIAGVGLLVTADEALNGPAGLGAVCGVIGGLPLLAVEYYAVYRRSRRASMLIASFLLCDAFIGCIAWLAGLMTVLRLISPNPDSMSPGGFFQYSAFLACLIAVGLGHLRWHRMLSSATIGRSSDEA